MTKQLTVHWRSQTVLMVIKSKEAWSQTKSPDVIWLGNANKEMMTFNHMRQVREEVVVKTYAIKKKNKMWSRRATVLPTLRFSREFGLVFLWSWGFFLELAGCFSFGLFQLIFACFLQICVLRIVFFQCLWHFCCFNVQLKAYWVCFYENLLILGLFFRI